MIATAFDVDRAEVDDALEARGQRRPVEARRVPRHRNLEEHAPELVVDHLVVLVLRLAAETVEHRVEANELEQVRIAEREVQRDHELGLVAGDHDLDALSL